MIQVTDDNKFIITGNDLVKEASRISIALLELTRKLNDEDPKEALAFLRAIHSMANGLAKPIVEAEDKKADASLKQKMAEKRRAKKKKIGKFKETKGADRTDGEAVSSEVITKGEQLDGDTKQCDTSSDNATDSSEFDSIRSDKSATASKCAGSTEKEVISK